MRRAAAYPNHRRLQQVSYNQAMQDLHMLTMFHIWKCNKLLTRWLTVVVQSILRPFSTHNAQEHSAQVMRTENRVANVLKHSLFGDVLYCALKPGSKPTINTQCDRSLTRILLPYLPQLALNLLRPPSSNSASCAIRWTPQVATV
jgi:hypothetical protein